MKRKVIVHSPCPECEQQMFASGGNWIQDYPLRPTGGQRGSEE